MAFTMKLQSPSWDGTGRTVTDAAINSASTTLNSATAAFTADDVGAPAVVVGAGAAGVTLETTISAIIGPTQATLGTAASTTVSGKNARIGRGYEIPLPVSNDSYAGDSLAAILALTKGENKIFDLQRYREVIPLTGVLTVEMATQAGFSNPIHMRDEMRRMRAKIANYGKNLGSAASWLDESISGNWTSTALVAAGEADGSTARSLLTCRLVWDKYWNPSTSAYANLFAYGSIGNLGFGPRPGATTSTRIPFSINFLVGVVKVG